MVKNKKMLTAVILYMSLYQMGMVGLSPVISDVSSAFPNASELAAQMASTFPALMMVVAAVFSSTVTKAIGNKWTAIVGAAMIVVAGVCGLFCSLTLSLLFCWAGLMGLGIGLVVPVANSLVVDNYEGDERTKVAGWQTCAVNIGGVLLSLLAGVLAAIQWNNAFLVFWAAIGALLLGLRYLPDDRKGKKPIAEKDQSAGQKRTWPPLYVWVCAITTFCFAVIYFAFSTNASLLLTERGYSSTTIAGLATACFMLGGGICGIGFATLERKLGKNMPTVAFVMLAVSDFAIYFTNGLVVLCIAAAIGGASLSLLFPHLLISLADYVSPETLVLSTSLVVSIGPNLGSFVSPLILTNVAALFGSAVSLRFLLSAVLAVVGVVVYGVIKPLERAARWSGS